MKEYSLKQQWKSPNGTIRAALDGTVFRKPILVPNVTPSVASWKKPIIVGRHAYGDVYKNAEIAVPGPGKGELVFTGADGEGPAGPHPGRSTAPASSRRSTTPSGRSGASRKSCFNYALDEKVDMWFATKDTISKIYDQTFKLLFEDEFAKGYREKFKAAGIEYFYTLIDDVVARVMKGEGGMLWACKNYDGDVMSDMVASAFGSLAMMTSVLVSPDGVLRVRGGARHGAEALLQAPEGGEDVEQLDGAHLRLDRRDAEARRARRPAGSHGLRRPAGAGVARHDHRRRDDRRPRAPRHAAGEERRRRARSFSTRSRSGCAGSRSP